MEGGEGEREGGKEEDRERGRGRERGGLKRREEGEPPPKGEGGARAVEPIELSSAQPHMERPSSTPPTTPHNTDTASTEPITATLRSNSSRSQPSNWTGQSSAGFGWTKAHPTLHRTAATATDHHTHNHTQPHTDKSTPSYPLTHAHSSPLTTASRLDDARHSHRSRSPSSFSSPPSPSHPAQLVAAGRRPSLLLL